MNLKDGQKYVLSAKRNFLPIPQIGKIVILVDQNVEKYIIFIVKRRSKNKQKYRNK